PLRPQVEKTTTDEYRKILNGTKGSLASKIGLYWYGFHEDDVLTAGRYYYAGWNPSNREETYKLNPHYRKENQVIYDFYFFIYLFCICYIFYSNLI
ncbi:hypothetical protein, partial [Mycoplasmopsis bovis]|uniref:hypothetical protein n=1 Tax=Mycoplasmopsis bovis TaxID=28903 RepID=UPI003D2834DE